MPTADFDAFVESLHEAGSSDISFAALAKALDISVLEFAQSAGVDVGALQLPAESRRAQRFAEDTVRVICAALEVSGDLDQVKRLIKGSRIQELGNKTALALVKEGRTDQVLRYLQTLRAGFVG